MNMTTQMWVMIAVASLIGAWMVGDILKEMLGLNLAKLKSKRKKQLNTYQTLKKEKSNDEQIQELLEAVTKPVIVHVLPRLKPKDFKRIDKELKLLGWDKHFTAEKFVALRVGMKILGIALLVLFYPIEPIVGLLWFGALFFVLDLGYKGELDNKYQEILKEFPDFLELVEGYLSAGYDFVSAVEEVMPAMTHWKPILKEFLIKAHYENLEAGLNLIKNTVEVFEVREFIAILQLGIEQGLDMGESLRRQSKAVEELKDLVFEKKLIKREILGIAVQGPLLITVLVAFALPTVYQMISLDI